jgi:hypothetical protein
MGGFKLGKKLTRRAELAASRVLQALTNPFRRIGARCNVEQALIGLGVLHHCSLLMISSAIALLLHLLAVS